MNSRCSGTPCAAWLNSSLRKVGNFACQEADSFDALMRLADHDDDLDAVLLDLSLLRQQGFGELVALRSKLPSVPVIVFSGREDAGHVHLCMTCGVVGFISKLSSRKEIVAALRTVFEGGIAVPRCGPVPPAGAFRRRLAADEQECGALSDRQAAVLNLVTDGKIEQADCLGVVYQRDDGKGAYDGDPAQAGRQQPGAGDRAFTVAAWW